MRYNRYSYIYPPRPKNAIPTKEIKSWDNGMMLGQPKMNGSNCTIFMNGNVTHVMNRHNQRLTNFRISQDEMMVLYEPCKKGEWLVINGEYMNKSKSDERGEVFNHKLVIFDILVLNSDHLVGSTFDERVRLLDTIYENKECEKEYLLQITENIYRVKTYEDNFADLYDRFTKIDMIEGLVMKRKSAKLELGTTENNNTKSQVKARKSTKNYKF